MRQHKYRFWDGKTMIYHGYQHAGLSFHGLLVCEGDTIPLEWTGLKDKNGKEIYEGDVVQHREDGNRYNGRIGVVEYVTDNGQGTPINGYWCRVSDDEAFSIWPKESKVIGNIYENPELLDAELKKLEEQ